jgi:hypothetical protein
MYRKYRRRYKYQQSLLEVAADTILNKIFPRKPEKTRIVFVRKLRAYAPKPKEDIAQRYSLKPSLLAAAESNFLKVLKEVVGDHYQIIPQVQLSRIMNVRDSNSHFTNYADFNRIAEKSIDFVLYDEKLREEIF